MSIKWLVVGLMSLSLLVAGCGTSQEEQGFVGVWETTDTSDASYMTLVISSEGDGEYKVILHDCGCSAFSKDDDNGPIYACTAISKGIADGDTINVDITARCMGCPSSLDNEIVVEGVQFTYNRFSDTIIDNMGNPFGTPGSSWNRLSK